MTRSQVSSELFFSINSHAAGTNKRQKSGEMIKKIEAIVPFSARTFDARYFPGWLAPRPFSRTSMMLRSFHEFSFNNSGSVVSVIKQSVIEAVEDVTTTRFSCGPLCYVS